MELRGSAALAVVAHVHWVYQIGSRGQGNRHRQLIQLTHIEIELIIRRAAGRGRALRVLRLHLYQAVRGGQRDARYGLRAARYRQVACDVVPDIRYRPGADSAAVVLVEDSEDRIV